MGALLFLIVAVISVFAFYLGKIVFYKPFKEGKLFSPDLFPLYLPLFIGSFIFLKRLPEFLPVNLFLLVGIAGGIILWMVCRQFSFLSRFLLQLVLCAGSVLLFSNVSFSLHLLWQLPVLTLTFWLCWQGFIWFDRFPFVSFINTLSWTLALCGMGFLIHSVPNLILGLVFLLGTVGILLMRSNLVRGIPCFGKEGALLLGFFWSALFVYLISMGAVAQTLCFAGYYIFEAIVLGMAFIYHRPVISSLSSLMENPKLFQKGIGIIFVHQLILSFWGAMILFSKSSSITGIVIFILTVVLIDLAMRLHNLEHPAPGYKELLTGTKESISLIADQIKKGFSFKKKVVVKKSSKKKKSVKKVRKK